MRNLLSAAPHRQRAMIAALVRTVFAQPDAATARLQLRAVVDQLTPYAPTVAERLEAMEADVLAYTDFPAAHWSKIWSNNPIPVFESQAPQASRRRLLGSVTVPESDSNPISTPPTWTSCPSFEMSTSARSPGTALT
jgi:transposase-like protein